MGNQSTSLTDKGLSLCFSGPKRTFQRMWPFSWVWKGQWHSHVVPAGRLINSYVSQSVTKCNLCVCPVSPAKMFSDGIFGRLSFFPLFFYNSGRHLSRQLIFPCLWVFLSWRYRRIFHREEHSEHCTCGWHMGLWFPKSSISCPPDLWQKGVSPCPSAPAVLPSWNPEFSLRSWLHSQHPLPVPGSCWISLLGSSSLILQVTGSLPSPLGTRGEDL